MILDCYTAEKQLEWAAHQNPGGWVNHSKFVAIACKRIADKCDNLSSDLAYCYGLLHDIGRYTGISSERHLIDGYRFCNGFRWDKAAQICISHAFMIKNIHSSIGVFDVTDEDFLFIKRFLETANYDDYDRLVQLCDALSLPTGFCILEKRFVDVALRYGMHPYTLARWKKTIELKEYFERKADCSIYDLLPEVKDNIF